jgi:hypothetical protein
MAFADPQSLTIAAVANSMPRTSTDGSKSIYMKSDENLVMTVSHNKTPSRINSLVRYDQRIVAADVLSAENKFQTATVKVIVERPLVGFTNTQIKDLWAAIKTQLDNSAVDKIFGQET